MRKFEDMWKDINDIAKNNKCSFCVDCNLKNVFLIKNEGNTIILTKEDFVNIWTKLVLYNKINIDVTLNSNDKKNIYMIDFLKELPYVKEEEGELVLM